MRPQPLFWLAIASLVLLATPAVAQEVEDAGVATPAVAQEAEDAGVATPAVAQEAEDAVAAPCVS